MRRLPSLIWTLAAVAAVRPCASAQARKWEEAMRSGTRAYQSCDFQQAEKEFRKAALAATHFDLGDPRLVETLNSAAGVFLAAGRMDRAEVAPSRALAMGETWLGPEHPAVADTLHALGVLYVWERRLDQAESALECSLQIRESVFGARSPQVAQTLTSLAELYLNERQYSRAELPLQRALEIWRHGGEDSMPGEAATLDDLGLLYSELGEYAQAEHYFRESLRQDGAATGSRSCGDAPYLMKYAEVLRKLQRNTEADRLQAEALQMAARHLPKR